jgi:hypothetical protein
MASLAPTRVRYQRIGFLLLLAALAVAGALWAVRAAEMAGHGRHTPPELAPCDSEAAGQLPPSRTYTQDQRLLQKLTEECAKGQDTLITLDPRTHGIVVQTGLHANASCAVLDIALRGSVRRWVAA